MLTFNPISRESDQSTYDSLSQSISALVQTDKHDFALRLFQVTEESEYQSFIVFDKLVKLAPIIDALGSYLRYQGLHNINILSPGDHYILPLQSGFRWMNEKVKPVVARREMSLDVALDFFCSEVMKGHVDDELFLEALLAANEALASSGAKQSARLFAISGGAETEEKPATTAAEADVPDSLLQNSPLPDSLLLSEVDEGSILQEDPPAIESPGGARTVGYLSRLFSLDPLDEIKTLPAILDDELDSGIIYEDRVAGTEPEMASDNVVEVDFFRGESSSADRQAEIMELLQTPAVREFLDEQAVQQEESVEIVELKETEIEATEIEEIGSEEALSKESLQEEALPEEALPEEALLEEAQSEISLQEEVLPAETRSELLAVNEVESDSENSSELPVLFDQAEAVVFQGKSEEARTEAEDIFADLASAEPLEVGDDIFDEADAEPRSVADEIVTGGDLVADADEQFRVVGLDSGDDEPGAALYEQLHFPFAQGLVEPQVYKEKVDRQSAS
ncbi:MAG: hypothetical protein K2Y32_11040 [Candidatus Obscuribacterales bacterium]|nr:hypothetical protein [Candidatus Obscuribacterales bacterium]